MMGNYYVRFLGEKGVVTALTYPVLYITSNEKTDYEFWYRFV